MPRGLKSTSAFVVLFLVALASLSAVLVGWAEGKPKNVVRLEIGIPKVEADYCRVVVERLPGRSWLALSGRPERVYLGGHVPGDTVMVSDLLHAKAAKTVIDSRTGERVVEYYEPVEYMVAVLCVGRGGTRYKYGRIHEVVPKALVWTYRVDVDFVAERPSEEVEPASTAISITCDLDEIHSYWEHAERQCFTFVRGPMLYSLEGLSTSFGVVVAPLDAPYTRPSAVYLEAYYDIKSQIGCAGFCLPEWKSAGKKLVAAVRSSETAPLSGNLKDRVYFVVLYEYVQACYDDPFAGGFCSWYLYPAALVEVRLSGELAARGLLPWGEVELGSYTPPSPPGYARLSSSYDMAISFGLHDVTETDDVLASTTIDFRTVVNGVPVTWRLTVNFYKARRDDSSYATPYLRIVNPRGRVYQWWFRDNDPATYEILLEWRPGQRPWGSWPG